MFHQLQRRLILSLVLIASLALVACNSQRKLMPISGRVTIDGQPLETGKVTVWVKDYRPAQGMIGKDGRFTLLTRVSGDGCAIGEHDVTVSSTKRINEETVKHLIPMRYDDPTQSKLKINVTKPDDNWNIELSWKGDSHGAPYQE